MTIPSIALINTLNKQQIIGQSYLQAENEILQQHFPGFPTLPAAIMVEISLELARYYLWQHSQFQLSGLLQSISRFKCHMPALPGQTLTVSNDIQTQLPIQSEQLLQFSTHASIASDKVYSGILMVKTFPLDQLHHQDGAKQILNEKTQAITRQK